ncbi:MAG TPA: YHYH protein, partial [Balneolales bacterium]|nr:YHYH protein [Balneolales bacterium]
MKKLLPVLLVLFVTGLSFGQSSDPILSSWLLNTTGVTGYNGLPANVQKVQYSQDYVYISSSGIPAYSIGPWPGDPNQASDQSFVFQIPRNPTEETGTKTFTPLGTIGVLINGVAIFNAEDAHTYNNMGIWHRNAVVVEASSFDTCLGHPQMQAIYHHHQNPGCLYKANSTNHSPI